jgi:hypothetical protein
MESKILREDVKIEQTIQQGTPAAPPLNQVRLLENLKTNTFEVEGRQEHSLLAIAERSKIMQCGTCLPIAPGVPNATYELSPTCGVVGRQYIKVARCNGVVRDTTGATPPNDTFINCEAEGNTKTIFVMD